MREKKNEMLGIHFERRENGGIYDPNNPTYERVMEFSNVDVNNRIIMHRCIDE